MLSTNLGMKAVHKCYHLIALALALLTILGCIPANLTDSPKTLSELQITACDEAHVAQTCTTRLEELGLVTPEDCCEVLQKCC